MTVSNTYLYKKHDCHVATCDCDLPFGKCLWVLRFLKGGIALNGNLNMKKAIHFSELLQRDVDSS